MVKQILFFSIFISLNCSAQLFDGDANFDVLFEDNFNTLNPANWHIEDGLDGNSTKSMRSTLASVQNGNLVLRGENNNYLGRQYSYGSIRTHNNYNVGTYFEVRSLLPQGVGTNANAWLWGGIHGTGGNPPNCGCTNYNEIDFLEWFGSANLSTRNVHFCPTNGSCVTSIEGSYNVPNPFTQFHSWGVYWNPQRTTFYLDGNPHTSDVTRSSNSMRLALQMNIHTECGCLHNASFPMIHQYDYVRIYRIRRDCNTIVTHIPNFNTFNYSLKRSITLGSNTIVPNTRRIDLWAREFIEFNDGFEIPTSNHSISFGINECW